MGQWPEPLSSSPLTGAGGGRQAPAPAGDTWPASLGPDLGFDFGFLAFDFFFLAFDLFCWISSFPGRKMEEKLWI